MFGFGGNIMCTQEIFGFFFGWESMTETHKVFLRFWLTSVGLIHKKPPGLELCRKLRWKWTVT